MSDAAQKADLAFRSHDHASCAGDVLMRVAEIAGARGLRLTPVRQRVLEILLEEHRAIGAYELLDRLSAEGFGAQPPVAYRALDYLAEHGLVHRISRLNAFAACLTPDLAHLPVFLICESCDRVQEAPGAGVIGALDEMADGHGFRLRRVTIEALGLCPDCAAAAAAPAP